MGHLNCRNETHSIVILQPEVGLPPNGTTSGGSFGNGRRSLKLKPKRHQGRDLARKRDGRDLAAKAADGFGLRPWCRRRSPLTPAMRNKLKRAGRRSRYRLRKHIVEPVFGQIKQARGFRQFLLRGLEKS